MGFLKSAANRVFGVRGGGEVRDRQEKRADRKIRSDSFTRSRTNRMGGEMPPVLARRGRQDMATPSRHSRSLKRRYDVALNIPGAEVRLPSIPSVQFSWRILSGLIVVMMAAAAYMLLSTPTFQVDLVEVEGLERLSLADLDLVLGITGEPVVSLDANEIREVLLDTFHGIRDAKVVIGLPASVQLQVRERQPVVAWVYEGETRWVDEAGILFNPGSDQEQLPLTVQAEVLPMLPSPTEDEASQMNTPVYERFDPKLVQVIQSMTDYLPAGAVMVFDDNHGLGWTDERGWQVYFGISLDEIDQKLIVYQRIVKEMEAKGIQPSMISVEYLHAPFYRMER